MTVQSHTTTANIERENVVRSTSAFAVHSGMEFADEDRTFPYRIVGSYEYGTSLSNLGALVDSSTSEQIEVYDKLIGLNSEYSFYSGVVTDLGFDTDFSSSDGESSSDVESGYLQALTGVDDGTGSSGTGSHDVHVWRWRRSIW